MKKILLTSTALVAFAGAAAAQTVDFNASLLTPGTTPYLQITAMSGTTIYGSSGGALYDAEMAHGVSDLIPGQVHATAKDPMQMRPGTASTLEFALSQQQPPTLVQATAAFEAYLKSEQPISANVVPQDIMATNGIDGGDYYVSGPVQDMQAAAPRHSFNLVAAALTASHAADAGPDLKLIAQGAMPQYVPQPALAHAA